MNQTETYDRSKQIGMLKVWKNNIPEECTTILFP